MRSIGISVLLLSACAAACVAPGTEPGEGDTDDTASAIIKPPVGPVLDGGVFDPGTPTPTLYDRAFTIRTLGSRCVDGGPRKQWVVRSPATIRDCDGNEGQRIRIRELDFTSHDVELSVGGLCLGVAASGKPPIVKTKALATTKGVPNPLTQKTILVGDRLELLTCDPYAAQRFALDGDAILIGNSRSGHVSREYVIEPQNDYTASGTPLVVGTRELSDAEYFLFNTVDGSGFRPTSGFIQVVNEAGLDAALTKGWGTVIEVASKAPLEIPTPPTEWVQVDPKDIEHGWVWTQAYKPTKNIPAGFTLRGNRLRTSAGGSIVSKVQPSKYFSHQLFRVNQDDVRITGLSLLGPSTSTEADRGGTNAVTVEDGHRVLIDRNDISAWTGSAIAVEGGDNTEWRTWQCTGIPWDAVRPTPVRAVKNFIHHNRMQGSGYGFVVGGGAYSVAQGNVFGSNRHSIASDAFGKTGYHALDGLFLRDAPDYGHGPESDVDVHGSNRNGDPQWTGGIAGDHYEVAWNTFLGTNRNNFYSRGKTCRYEDLHDNVARKGEADDFTEARDGAFGSSDGKAKFVNLEKNKYGVDDPTLSTAVGDFDGDGLDDIFVGTGAGWYFSSGGRSEWRFLNRKDEKTLDLRFGDFDHDGRTDVVALQGAEIVVSWGGISEWQAINVTAGTLADIAVGDFDGDGFSDLFYANGTTWYFAPKGRNWQYFATSGFRTPNLRFADFTNDKRTDVLGVTGGNYAIVTGIDGTWTPIGPARTPNLDRVVAADFDGDDIADIGFFSGTGIQGGVLWMIFQWSKSGAAPLVNRAMYPVGYETSGLNGIGRFDTVKGTDIVWSNGARFFLSPNSTLSISPLSWSDMH